MVPNSFKANEKIDFEKDYSKDTNITDEISRLNQSGNLVFENTFFYPVLMTCKEVHSATKGAFDPTIGPLVIKATKSLKKGRSLCIE